jgi:hypothetical protein
MAANWRSVRPARSIVSIKPDVAAHLTKMPLAEEIAGSP